MLAAVEFDDEAELAAGDVGEILADTKLTQELVASKPFVTQSAPQLGFGVIVRFAQSSCDASSSLVWTTHG